MCLMLMLWRPLLCSCIISFPSKSHVNTPTIFLIIWCITYVRTLLVMYVFIITHEVLARFIDMYCMTKVQVYQLIHFLSWLFIFFKNQDAVPIIFICLGLRRFGRTINISRAGWGQYEAFRMGQLGISRSIL